MRGSTRIANKGGRVIVKKTDDVNVNERIHAKAVRLIGSDGQQPGILPTQEAMDKAIQEGLDLVEVAPKSDPPVCKIMDYGKYKYQTSKKLQEGKKKSKTLQLKEVRVSRTTRFRLKHRSTNCRTAPTGSDIWMQSPKRESTGGGERVLN